jgi:hypothetical protein
MTVVPMSRRELSRFDTLLRVQRRELRAEDAAELLGLSRRQIFRLLDKLREYGAEGLVSRKRGGRSNHRLADELKAQATALVRERYHDFGPTFAAEKLAELHDIHVSRETLRS